VGDQPYLTAFEADDSFIRRIERSRYLRDGGEVSYEAFRPREGEASLSFTFQDKILRTDAALDEYQSRKALPQSGHLPGLCRLTLYDLTVSLTPPLPPRYERDDSDDRYGHLHCVTDLPSDEQHMERMAKLATRNGLVRPYVRAKRK